VNTRIRGRANRREGAAVRTRRRSRFGYERLWAGDRGELSGDHGGYLALTRKPLPCLAFVAPLLIVYEFGVLWQGATAGNAIRSGADAWIRQGLATIGLTDHWLLPITLVVLLLSWQAVSRSEWRFPPWAMVLMAVESLLLAVALVGLSRVVDLGFNVLERRGPVRLEASASTTLLGFLGAGIYEEALFRLILIPVFYAGLRLLMTPRVLASSVAVTASSLLFSLAHHAGMPGEVFTWYAFIFRWLAGVYFAWVFVARGYGVAVGTHTAYDVLVGWLGWHL
jgi:hypothetical protein